MKAPKILPWIARKSAISDELALNLWRRAAGEAEELSGNCDSDDYFRLAVERFISLCEDEGKSARNSELHWLKRQQDRVVQINLLAARKTWQLWLAHWNSFFTRPNETSQPR